MKKVLVIDTSMLCVWLQVPGIAPCQIDGEEWNKARIDEYLEQEKAVGTEFVLPLAVIIETGNHIAQANMKRRETAEELSKVVADAADGSIPWIPFTRQVQLWEPENLKSLLKEWVELAAQKLSIGDATIKAVTEFYSRSGYSVEILTGDRQLKSYEQITPPTKPGRRSG
jgi:hypothetical protein